MEEREESDAKFSRNQDKLGLAALREEKGTSRDETIGGGKIQRSAKRYANLAKQDPSRTRPNR